jgi:hypothetical protein
MAYSFISKNDVNDNSSGTTLNGPSTTYAAHDTAIVEITYGGTAQVETVTDGTNTYVRAGSSQYDVNNDQTGATFVCKDCAAGTFTPVMTLPLASSFRDIGVSRYNGLDNSATPQAISAVLHNIGTGTDLLTSGNITPASQPAMLYAFIFEDSGVGASAAAGTGFTDRTGFTNWNTGIGPSRVEDRRLTATTAVAGTFTANNASNTFIIRALVILEASTIAAVGSRRGKNTIHPGKHPDRFGRHLKTARNKTVITPITVTGTISATLGNDSLAGSGNSTINGSLSTTLGNDILAASGVPVMPAGSRRLKIPNHPGRGPYNFTHFRKSPRNTAIQQQNDTGTIAVTLGNDTLASSGSPTNIGSIGVTLGNDSLAGSGAPRITGTIGISLGNDTSAASGSGKIIGSIGVTLANDGFMASGNVSIFGSISKTLQDDNLSAFGYSGNPPSTPTYSTNWLSPTIRMTILLLAVWRSI